MKCSLCKKSVHRTSASEIKCRKKHGKGPKQTTQRKFQIEIRRMEEQKNNIIEGPRQHNKAHIFDGIDPVPWMQLTARRHLEAKNNVDQTFYRIGRLYPQLLSEPQSAKQIHQRIGKALQQQGKWSNIMLKCQQDLQVAWNIILEHYIKHLLARQIFLQGPTKSAQEMKERVARIHRTGAIQVEKYKQQFLRWAAKGMVEHQSPVLSNFLLCFDNKKVEEARGTAKVVDTEGQKVEKWKKKEEQRVKRLHDPPNHIWKAAYRAYMRAFDPHTTQSPDFLLPKVKNRIKLLYSNHLKLCLHQRRCIQLPQMCQRQRQGEKAALMLLNGYIERNIYPTAPPESKKPGNISFAVQKAKRKQKQILEQMVIGSEEELCKVFTLLQQQEAGVPLRSAVIGSAQEGLMVLHSIKRHIILYQTDYPLEGMDFDSIYLPFKAPIFSVEKVRLVPILTDQYGYLSQRNFQMFNVMPL